MVGVHESVLTAVLELVVKLHPAIVPWAALHVQQDQVPPGHEGTIANAGLEWVVTCPSRVWG